MLERVDNDLQDAVHDAGIFSTEFIDKAAQKWSKNRSAQESGNEESRNIDIVG